MMSEQSQQMMKRVATAFELEQTLFDGAQFEAKLAMMIEQLLEKDFARLINILYRLDVDEEKLKFQLGNEGAPDAARIIARLIIERQLEKMQTGWQQAKGENIPDEDKW